VTADRAGVERHLRELRRLVVLLRRHSGVRPEELAQDLERALMIERALHLAIQNVLNVGNHLLAARGQVVPDTYEQILVGLGRVGIIPADFAERIRRMAGLRNVLVHAYLDVDPVRLVDALSRIDDFEAFARHVLTELGRSSG